jgi:hypothetical protein
MATYIYPQMTQQAPVEKDIYTVFGSITTPI